MVFFLLFEVKGTVLSTSCLLECPKSSFNVALFLCYVRLRGKLRIMECGRVVRQCDTLRGIPKLLHSASTSKKVRALEGIGERCQRTASESDASGTASYCPY